MCVCYKNENCTSEKGYIPYYPEQATSVKAIIYATEPYACDSFTEGAFSREYGTLNVYDCVAKAYLYLGMV